MPNFAIPDGGYGAGAQAHDATFFLTVMEEYGTGDVGADLCLIPFIGAETLTGIGTRGRWAIASALSTTRFDTT